MFLINFMILKVVDRKIVDKKYLCSKCNKSFDFYQSRWRHEKKCDYSDNKNKDTEIKIQKKQILLENLAMNIVFCVEILYQTI